MSCFVAVNVVIVLVVVVIVVMVMVIVVIVVVIIVIVVVIVIVVIVIVVMAISLLLSLLLLSSAFREVMSELSILAYRDEQLVRQVAKNSTCACALHASAIFGSSLHNDCVRV